MIVAPGETDTATPRSNAVRAWPLAGVLTALAIWLHVSKPERFVGVFLGLYLPSIVLVGIGCLPVRRERRPEPRPGVLPRRTLGALTIGVLGMATFLRVWGLGVWPPTLGNSFEEAQLGMEASRLLHDGALPNEHLLAISAPAVSFAVLGASLTTLRAPFVIAAILTPFFLFAAARRLLAPELALFAVALHGVSWWAVSAGRIADELFFPAALTPLAFLWLVDFAGTARPFSAFVLALVSGLLAYEYTGYHIVPVLVAAYGVAAALVAASRWLMRRQAETAGAALRRVATRWAPGVFVIALVWTDLGMRQFIGDVLQGRRYFVEGFARHQAAGCGLSAVSRDQWPEYAAARSSALWQAAFAPAGGGGVPHMGFAGHPLFDPASAALVLGGLALLALTFWRRFHLLLAAWIGGTVAVATLFPCAVNPHRYFTILPIVFLAAAMGWQVAWDRLRKSGRAWLAALLGTGAALSALSNVGHLCRAFFSGSASWAAFDDPSTRVSLWLAAREPEALTWVVSDLFEHLGQPNDYYWLVDGRRAVTADSLVDVVPSPERPVGPLYYLAIAKASQPGLAELLRSRYPDVERLDSSAIEIEGMDVQAFRVAHAGSARPLDGFAASYWASEDPTPGPGATPPADARLLLARREPMLSSLSIPLVLKKRAHEERAQGTFFWCSWRGAVFADQEGESAFRLYVRGGDAWARVNAGAPMSLAAAPGQEASLPFRASLRRGRNTLAMLYRLGPREMVGAQLYRVDADGRERVAAAPTRDGVALGEPLAPSPGARRSDATMARVLHGGGFVLQPGSSLRFAVPAGARALEGMVGLGDGHRGCAEASVRFEARAPDGRRLFESGRVTVARPQAALSADVTGLREVVVAVTDAEDGRTCDQGFVGRLLAYETPDPTR